MIARLLARIFALIAPKPVAGIKPQTQPLSEAEIRARHWLKVYENYWSGKRGWL